MTATAPVCRSCGSENLSLVLSLGRMPLANALLAADQLAQEEAAYPLDLAFCPQCSLVQITETVPPEQLFREYLYFSSFSDTMLRHAAHLSGYIAESRGLNSRNLVLEIASNDGYLLQYYQQRGIPVLGIEPALNVARVAQEERGIHTLCEFFDATLAQDLRLQGIKADVIHAHNVLAHVADLNGFVEGLGILLDDHGAAVIEVPYLKDLIDHCEFDTIYHEHLCYFSLTALDRLFQRRGLIIFDVERVPIHGGSLRLWAGKADKVQPGERVRSLLAEENAWGVDREEFYQEFARGVENLKCSLNRLLKGLKEDGRRLAAYGAAAKGSTLLNFCGIGQDTLDFVVDRSTHKQGRHMPGVRLPIHPPARLLESQPDYVLMLTWNFAPEILEQQREYLQRGGRFIIPLPEMHIV
ncbi:MAG: class I SAM-dependent methyltransferase [Syntrophales bacterium]|nr:class I SAM-dependent methyltransferase [Syntrophales bacterium]MDD5640355.1 class I SAM-dependent methyltransferase [Syntrophales bacterium]